MIGFWIGVIEIGFGIEIIGIISGIIETGIRMIGIGIKIIGIIGIGIIKIRMGVIEIWIGTIVI